MPHILTDREVKIHVWLATGAAGVGWIICTLVIAASIWVYTKPHARHHFDRVSFRLLLWSMLFEWIYDLVFIAIGVQSATNLTNNGLCGTAVYGIIATTGVLNFLYTSVAINLMLTICFGVNPVKARLELYYVGLSIGLGLGIPIIPAALGHFGLDPILHVCWIRAASDVARMRNFVLDLYLWQILSCFITFIAVFATLWTLFAQVLHSSRAMRATSLMSTPFESDDGKSTTHFNVLQERISKITLRILLYPIVFLIITVVVTVSDLMVSKAGGVFSTAVYRLYTVHYLLYGGRSIILALLFILADPGLRKGLRAARRVDHTSTTMYSQESGIPYTRDHKQDLSFHDMINHRIYNDHGPLETPLDEFPISRKESMASVGMFDALRTLHFDSDQSPTYFNSTGHVQDSPHGLTRSFPGVKMQALPSGLTDIVDVISTAPADSTSLKIEVEKGSDVGMLEPDLPNEVEVARRTRRAIRVKRQEVLRITQERESLL